MQNNQFGRSMIEMLGVLAIIGVLSVGGIAGYSKAMMKFKVNKTIDETTQIATNIRTLFGGQRSYASLSADVMEKAHLIPDEMLTATSGKYMNAWGEEVTVETSVKTDATAEGSGGLKAFMITSKNIPVEACIELAVLDWGATSGTGLVAVGVNTGGDLTAVTTVSCVENNSDYVACANASDEAHRIPMDPARAVEACSSTTGFVDMYWKFY